MKRLIFSLLLMIAVSISAFSATNGFISYHDSGTDFLLSAQHESDFSKYPLGTDIKLTLSMNKNCYVLILMNRPDGKTVLLSPNAFNSEMMLKEGVYSKHLGTAGIYPFETTGYYDIQLLATTYDSSFFNSTFEDFNKAKIPYYEFSERAEQLMLDSRMSTSPEWVARLFSINAVSSQGNLKLNTLPEGATIMIDGVEKGITPMNLTLDKGIHELILKKEGFDDIKDSVMINTDQNVGKNYTLTSTGWFASKKDIWFDSFPQGATIMIDGKELGTTPKKLSLDYGRHVISIFKDGYEMYANYIVVDADIQEVKKDLVLMTGLSAKTANLNVSVSPSDSELKLDGVVQKNTALTVTPGQHVIEVYKSGYEKYTQVFRIEKGATRQLNINMIPLMGTLYVNIENAFAWIFINGESYEKSPKEIKLPDGKYEITLVASGFRTVVKDVTIVSGQRDTLNEKMQLAPNKF